jgi:hypothetical protein
MKKAMFISGPVLSNGRSGRSWGSENASDWDIVFWDSTNDIVFNVEEATSLGFKCFYFYWENDEVAKNLNIPNLAMMPIADPFLKADLQFGMSDLPDLIDDFGPLVKNFTYNDQRQAFASHFGFSYLSELGFEISLRIRSDQKMNWASLSTDLILAYRSKRILFPAQRSLTSLDSTYTGFSVLDFFYGGESRMLSDWFSHVLVGGRIYGPHQDIAWKPLLNNAKWKSFFPGLALFSDINNSKKQSSMAQIFWQEFANPSSKETMNHIIWRGHKLETIDYKICKDEMFSIDLQRIEKRIEPKSITQDFSTNFEWDLVTNYIIGGIEVSSSMKISQSKILLDHLNFVLHNGKYQNRYLTLQVSKIFFLRRFRCIRSLVTFGKKTIFHSWSNR